MGVDRLGEVGNWGSEGQATGVYWAGFTVRSLAGKGARGRTRGTGNKVSSDKELIEVGRMAEGPEGLLKDYQSLPYFCSYFLNYPCLQHCSDILDS